MILASNVQDSVNVARIALSETRGQNWIRGNFGMKKNPRNTFLGPTNISDVLFASETKQSCKSIVSRCVCCLIFGWKND